MISDKSFKKLRVYLKYFYCLVTCIILYGCGATQTKVQVNEDPLTMAPTLAFIPVLEKDKEGNLIPYEAQINPYEKQKGRIKKEAIKQFILAKRLFTAKDYVAAKIKFEQITKAFPKLSGPWVYLGDIDFQSENFEKAESHYKKAIETNSENTNAYLRLGLAQRKQGKFLIAQHTYAKLLSMWPDFPEAHLNIGVLYDLYLNHPIRAQRHIEAFLFLTQGENQDIVKWLEDVKSRTGMATQLEYAPALAEGN